MNCDTPNMFTPAKNSKAMIWLIIFCLTYLSSFFLSGQFGPLPNAESSWSVVLEYAYRNNFQFGKDIVFTYGPLGFLNTVISQGEIIAVRVIFALYWALVVALSTVGLARRVSGTTQAAFIIWALPVSYCSYDEAFADYMLLPVLLVLIFSYTVLSGELRNKKLLTATLLPAIAIISLIKFTFLLAALLCMAISAFIQYRQGNSRYCILIPAAFSSMVLSCWHFSGQNLSTLIPWLSASLEIMSGYTEAMFIAPKKNVLIGSTVSGALFLASGFLALRSTRNDLQKAGLITLTGLYAFLIWKQAFIRADSWHLVSFIYGLPLISAPLLDRSFCEQSSMKLRRAAILLYFGIISSCIVAAYAENPAWSVKIIRWPAHLLENARLVFKIVSGEWRSCYTNTYLSRQYTQQPNLPRSKNLVGDTPVDVLSSTAWAALANNLNYHPRPVIQGYSVYSPGLQDRNLELFRSMQRPPYLLMKLETIDKRYPTLDDATALVFILQNYLPVIREGDFILLQQQQHIKSSPHKLIYEQVITFEEKVDLSAWNDKPLFMQVSMKPTLFGKVMSQIYQPPEIFITTVTKGKEQQFRFIPLMAERGFLLSPLLEDNNDILDYFRQAEGKRLQTVHFTRSSAAAGQFADSITIRLFQLARQ